MRGDCIACDALLAIASCSNGKSKKKNIYFFSFLRECFKLFSLKENNLNVWSIGKLKGRCSPEADMFFEDGWKSSAPCA